jgi:hypothetical protein
MPTTVTHLPRLLRAVCGVIGESPAADTELTARKSIAAGKAMLMKP